MKKPMISILLFLSSLVTVSLLLSDLVTAQNKTLTKVKVGLVVDYDRLVGRMGLSSIGMALSEFYESHGEYNTRLELHRRDSKSNVVGAVSAGQDLIRNTQVQAIIGPTTSTQAIAVIDLGEEANVPIISFSASNPFLNHQSSYFFRATQNEASQAKAIAAIVQAFGWKQVVPIYSGDASGEGLIPFLTDALLEANDAHMPYRYVVAPTVTMEGLRAELRGLMMKQVRVFVLHVNDLSLGKRIFAAAKEIEMMREGFVWIVTNVLTDMLSASMDSYGDLNGVLGIRTFVPETKELEGFRDRYRKGQFRDKEVDVFGLRAYDAATALAIAVEEVWNSGDGVKFGFTKGKNGSLMVSQSGPKLQRALSNVSFKGLTGNFSFVNGELQVSSYEIINVVNGDVNNVVGFWTPEAGLVRVLNNSEENYSASKDNLGLITWPGNPNEVPKGWEIPILGKKLKVGVPVRGGFREFVDVTFNSNNTTTITGYCIDVFEAVMKAMPYHVEYELIPYANSTHQSNGTYDELAHQVYDKVFDVVAGDLTIRSNRSQYVDFTFPYTESGVSMIVPLVRQKNKNAWVFMKPLTWDLWVTSACFFIFIGFVVWVLEHRINDEFRGPPSHQIGTSAWFAFSTMVFAHRERVVSNLARFVIIIWVFVVVILTQSYTASLTSLLTVQQLQPAVTNVTELIKNNEKVGCLVDSFVHGILNNLGFNDSQIEFYDTPEGLDSAFSKYGTSPDGVAAAFDENPYANLFLRRYCSKYAMVEPKFKADGFAFAFPKGSPLVPDVSRAILNVTETEALIKPIEKKWFGDKKYCADATPQISANRLGLESFSGLFLIAGVSATFALAIHAVIFFHGHWNTITRSSPPEASISDRIRVVFRLFDQIDSSSHTFKNNAQTVETQSNCSSAHGHVLRVDEIQQRIQSQPRTSTSSYSNRSELNIVGCSSERESVATEDRSLDQAHSEIHITRAQSSEIAQIRNN